MKRSLLTALALFAASTTAQAQDSNWCRNGLFPSEPPFELAEVTAPGRTFFYDDAGACPDGEGCRTRSYLIEGDKLLINRTFGLWT